MRSFISGAREYCIKDKNLNPTIHIREPTRTINYLGFAIHLLFCYYEVHMEQNTQQITHTVIGYTLIILGVFIMLLSVIQVYRVFTKQVEPIQYFNFPGIKMNMAQYMPKVDMQSLDALKQKFNVDFGEDGSTKDTANQVEMEIIPGEVINGPTNLAIHLLFMGFLMNFGAKIADLGTKLVRPIIVKGQAS